MATEQFNGRNSSDEIKSLRADISALKSDLSQLLSDAGATAGTFAQEGRATGKAAAQKATAKGEEVGHKAQDLVRDHPLAAVGVAMGVGALIGMLTRQ